MKKGSSQLTLDYFSGQLRSIKNDIEKGRKDPLLPLKDFIETFNRLKQEGETGLTDSVSIFHALCDIFDYKVHAFKSLLYSISSEKITEFLDDPEGLEKVARIIPWTSTVDLVKVSSQFLSKIIMMMEKEEIEIPTCVIDNYNRQEVEFTLHLDDELFSEQKNAIFKEMSSFLTKKRKMRIEGLIARLDEKLNLGKVKIFVLLLHLIQDGHLKLTGASETGVSTNQMIVLG